jgi:hypothetical protein
MKKIIISFVILFFNYSFAMENNIEKKILYFKNNKECNNNVIDIMEKYFVKKYIPIKNLKTEYINFENTGYYFYKENKMYRALFYCKENQLNIDIKELK